MNGRPVAVDSRPPHRIAGRPGRPIRTRRSGRPRRDHRLVASLQPVGDTARCQRRRGRISRRSPKGGPPRTSSASSVESDRSALRRFSGRRSRDRSGRSSSSEARSRPPTATKVIAAMRSAVGRAGPAFIARCDAEKCRVCDEADSISSDLAAVRHPSLARSRGMSQWTGYCAVGDP
jgi:hypothetical protein